MYHKEDSSIMKPIVSELNKLTKQDEIIEGEEDKDVRLYEQSTV